MKVTVLYTVFVCLLLLTIGQAFHPRIRPLLPGQYSTILTVGNDLPRQTGCDEVQMMQCLQLYIGGQYNNTVLTPETRAATGLTKPQGYYNFAPMYPFMNASSALTVTDLYTITGNTAIEADLAGYPPIVSRAYETLPSTAALPNPISLQFNVDGDTCTATGFDFRWLQEFRYNRTEIEYLAVHMYFTPNINRQNEFDGLYNPNSNHQPKVNLTLIHEFPSSGQSEWLLSYLHDTPQFFCGNYSQSICPSLVPNDFAAYATSTDPVGCLSYMNTLVYSYAEYPTLWLPAGPSLSCYNYYTIQAFNANWETWGLSYNEQVASCFLIGPSDGKPGRGCLF